MLSFGFPFDACQLPLNGFDARFRSFQALVLPELARQQIAAIGMKSLGGDGRAIRKRAARVDDALRYAMSLSVCTTVCGIDSMRILRQHLRIARGFSPMSAHRAAQVRSKPCRGRAGWTLRAVQDQRRARRRSRPPATRVPVSRGRSHVMDCPKAADLEVRPTPGGQSLRARQTIRLSSALAPQRVATW